MFKKMFLVVFLTVIFCASNVSVGAFPKVKGFGLGKTSQKKTVTVSLSDLTNSRNLAIGAYLDSTRELTMSLEKASEALGVKREVVEKLAVVKSLQEGNINDKDLKKARKASEGAQEIIKQKMQETKELSAESKKLMAKSMVHLGVGMKKEKDLGVEIKNLANQAKDTLESAPIQDKLKVKGVISTCRILSKNIPLDLKLSKDILSTYVAYAKAKNIKVPQDATKLLAGN